MFKSAPPVKFVLSPGGTAAYGGEEFMQMPELPFAVTIEQLVAVCAALALALMLVLIIALAALRRSFAINAELVLLRARIRSIEVSEGRAKMQAMYERHAKQNTPPGPAQQAQPGES